MLPAYAGMIRVPACARQGAHGAPRVCGDDPPPTLEILADPSVLPAYAGMIRTHAEQGSRRAGAPRVCGDDPGMSSVPEAPPRCSPRMRG